MKNFKDRLPIFIYKIYDSFEFVKNLFKKHPINNNNLSCTPFFIIGSGRSGNTLLRSILCNHKEISIPPESYVLKDIFRKYKTFNFLNWEDKIKLILGEFESHEEFYTWEIDLQPVYRKLLLIDDEKRTLSNIIDEIYKHYSEIKFPEANIWGDKTPINTLYLHWIYKMFPNAKYIHLIRDGRDVVSSYLKMGRYNNIQEAADRWSKSIKKSQELSKRTNQDQYYELYYEEMVSNPKEEIKKLCSFLNIEFDENILKHQ